MPTTVEVPSAGETLEFPDSMTEDQIRGVLKNRYQLSQQMKADVAAQKMREADKELTSAVGAVAFPKGRDSSAAELLSGIANAPFSMLNETLPHLSEDERRQLAKTSPTLEKIEAASESAGELAPMALPLGALSEGGTIGKGIGLAFGAQAATQVPEAFSRAGEISGDPNATGGEALMADVGAASTLGIAGLGLAGGAMPGKPGAAEVLSRAIDHASMGTPAELDAIKGGKPITIKVEPKPAPVTPVAQPEGEPNAVPERSATPLPVGQTPQDSGEVGARVPGTEEPAGAPPPVEAAPETPPDVPTEEVAPAATVKPLGGDVAGASGEAGAGRQGSPTAMKYKLIDQERQQRGEPPLTKPDSVSDQALLDKAMAEMDKDPEIPDKLVRELNSKPRTIEAWERMALLLRKIDLRNEYHKAVAETLQAYEDSKQFPDRKSDMVAAQLRRAQWGEKLDALERASRLSGSEVGRSLRSLQIMANEDYSLASMERDARAAKGGEDLTPQELSEIKRMSDEHAKATADLQRQLDTSRASEREAAAKLEAIKREVAAQPPIPPEVKVIADRLKSYFDQRADAALKRLSGKAWSLGPEIIADLTDLGVSKIISGASEFAGWSAQMLAQFPDKVDKIKPELKKIWDLANKAIDDRIKGERIDHAAQVKQAIKTRPVEEQIASRETAIGEKIASDKKGDITWHIQQLARLFVMQGETDRESLINKVHAVVSKFDPSMTRRDTMDAISGYGDFKQLSKDKISTTLRTLKGQMQQVSKLQDMQEGRPPLKTGVERREVSPEESRLIKLVNESKRQFQIPISDPSTQLKSSLDELKTRMQNRIHDLQDRLDRGDFESKPRRPIELDTRARELQARKNAIEHKFKSAKARWELESRPATEKTFDWVSNARRFSVLSGVNVLAKLAAYSATKIPTMAGAEAAGGVLSRLPGISKIAEKAPSEAGGRMDILSRSVAKGFTQGILDAYQTGTKGESQLRQAFGNRLDLGRHWYNVPQLIHEVIKSPLRRVAFENSLGRRMETAARNGADITDPLTQLSLAKDAYLDSDRALLLEQNRLATGIRNIFKRLEQPDKATGEVPLHGKISATVGRLEFPIMTVPFNFVKQSLVSAFGLASGSYKAAAAFRRGMETLKPEEADAIMRHLKQGSIGGAIMLYGFIDGYNHASDEENSTFGGFYQPGEHRKSTQAGVGGMKVMGHKIPGLLLHNPVLAAGQLGHTIGAITASKINKKTAETHGITVGMIAGTMGLLSDEPLGRNAELVSQLSNVRDADWGVGELEKNMLVPQIMQETSQWLDTDAKGNIIKRKPVTPWQHVETGIPGLRKQVPANPKQ